MLQQSATAANVRTNSTTMRLRITVALMALLPLFIIDWHANAVLNGALEWTWPQVSGTRLWPLEGQCEISTEGNGFATVRAILGAGALIQQQRMDANNTPSAWVITSASCLTDTAGNLVVSNPAHLQMRWVGSNATIKVAKRIIIHPTVKDLPHVQFIGVEGKLDLALIEVDIFDTDGVTPLAANRPTFPPGYPISGLILPPGALQPQGGLWWGAAPSVGLNFYLSAFGEKGTVNGVDNTFPANGSVNIGANTTPPGCTKPLNVIEQLTSTFVRWTFDVTPGCFPYDNNFSRADKGGLVTTRLGPPVGPRLSPHIGPLIAIASGGTITNSSQGDQPFCTRLDIASLWIQTYLDPSQFPPPGVEPRPDLIIPNTSAVTVTPTLSSNPLRVAAGQDLTVSVQFLNQAQPNSNGLTNATSSFLVSVFLNETGPVGGSGGAAGSAQSPPLVAGAAGLVTVGVRYEAAGNYAMAIVIDSDRAVPEANDLNNVIYIPITVVSRGTDLIISNVQKIDISNGVRHDFVVTVENLGLTASTAFDVGFFYNRPVAPVIGDTPDVVQTVPSLPPLGTITLSAFNLPTQDVARAGTAWFLAESGGVISEEIEGNNTASSVWGLANNPPAVSSAVTATKTLITVGETITFTVAATDPERDPLTYLWDFGDGTVQVGGATITHTFTTAGIFIITATIADGPYNSVDATFQIEAVTSIINLGTINRGSKRLRFKLPLPSGLIKRGLRSTLVIGSPGPGVRYRNLQINGPVPATPGEYSFGVEFLQPKTKTTPGKVVRQLYAYDVQ